MRSEVDIAEPEKEQRIYARLAGFLFLEEIALAIASGRILDHIAGSGSFAETARRVAASQHAYRAALSIVVIVSLSSAVLAFAQYATLKRVNGLLALLAMIFSLGDAFLALVVRMCSFVIAHLYVSTQSVGAGPIPAEAATDLMRSIASTTENLGGIAFGIGSLLFFLLFLRSRYIPRALSALGVLASGTWAALYFANLMFPERHALFQQVYFPPMALALVLTGAYLMLFGIRTTVRKVTAA
jgi:hypothetical protein